MNKMKRFLVSALFLFATVAYAQNPNTARWTGANAGDADLFVATNNAQTTLNGSIGSTDTSIILTDASKFVVPVIIIVESEFIHCQSKTSNTLTSCTRGQEGSTGATHASGLSVFGYLTQYHYNQLAAEIKAIEANAYHGSGTNNVLPVRTSGDVMGDSSLSQNATTGQISSSKGMTGPACTQSFSTTPTYNLANCNRIEITMTANITSSSFSNLQAGQKLTVVLAEDATGGWTNVWPSAATDKCPISTTALTYTTAQFEVGADSATVYTVNCTYNTFPPGVIVAGTGIALSMSSAGLNVSVDGTGQTILGAESSIAPVVVTGSSSGHLVGNETACSGFTYSNAQAVSFQISDGNNFGSDDLNVCSAGPVALKAIVGGAVVAIGAGQLLQHVTYIGKYTSTLSPAAFIIGDGINASTVGSTHLTSSSATSSVTLATSPSAGDYELHFDLDMHTACTTGVGQLALSFGWTGNGSRTLQTGSMALAASQSTSSYMAGVLPIHVVSGNITYTPTVVTACATGTATWDGDVWVTRAN